MSWLCGRVSAHLVSSEPPPGPTPAGSATCTGLPRCPALGCGAPGPVLTPAGLGSFSGWLSLPSRTRPHSREGSSPGDHCPRGGGDSETRHVGGTFALLSSELLSRSETDVTSPSTHAPTPSKQPALGQPLLTDTASVGKINLNCFKSRADRNRGPGGQVRLLKVKGASEDLMEEGLTYLVFALLSNLSWSYSDERNP